MKYYRLLTSLPPLPETVAPLPIGLSEILAEVRADVEGRDARLMSALLWLIDTANAERMFLGQDVFDPRGMLTREQLENRRDLPDFIEDFLAGEDSGLKPQASVERLWTMCFEAMVDVAEQHGSDFLREYALMEIGIRNALARVRAEESGHEGEVPQILGGEGADAYSALVMRAMEARDPAERAKRLDSEKISYIKELEGIDPFSADALMAYVATALILDQWKKEELSPDKLLEVFG